MEIRLLGTGDAVGTPHIGCSCKNCTYAKEHGIERLRTSVLVTNEGHNLLIDTTPDMRRQLLNAGSPRIDAVIWTHGHYDHFMGFGDFYRVQRPPPVYAASKVLETTVPVFKFLMRDIIPVSVYTAFSLFGLDLILIEVVHPNIYTTGVIIKNGATTIAYTSDTNEQIPEHSKVLIRGADLLLIDGLFPSTFRKVEKHLNYEEAVEMAGELLVKEFRVVHMSHHIPFDAPHQGYDECEFHF